MLLATCYEDWQLEALKGRQGSQIALTVDATGAVAASTVDLAPAGIPEADACSQASLPQPCCTLHACVCLQGAAQGEGDEWIQMHAIARLCQR